MRYWKFQNGKMVEQPPLWRGYSRISFIAPASLHEELKSISSNSGADISTYIIIAILAQLRRDNFKIPKDALLDDYIIGLVE